uniref:Uncharacterized protein n=1 Tax=mine drainage metagenome TaxID=410659 RepID=E6QWP8_9ZZZZ
MAILVLSAFAAVLSRAFVPLSSGSTTLWVATSIVALVIIHGLFFLRRKKFERIAQRWYVLRRLLRTLGDWTDDCGTMEAQVCWNFEKHTCERWELLIFWKRYSSGPYNEDGILHLLLTLPLILFIGFELRTNWGCVVGVGLLAILYYMWTASRLLEAIPEKTNLGQ